MKIKPEDCDEKANSQPNCDLVNMSSAFCSFLRWRQRNSYFVMNGIQGRDYESVKFSIRYIFSLAVISGSEIDQQSAIAKY